MSLKALFRTARQAGHTMVPDRQKIKEASTRSWNWVKKNTFNPVPFYRRSWEILRKDWLVFLWKLIADFISRSGTFTVVMFVVSLFIVDYQLYLELGNSPFGWIDRLVAIAQSPGFIAGFVGVAFFTTLLGTTMQAFVVGGIWGMIASGLRGEKIERWSTFARHTWLHFPNVLALFLIKLAVRTVTILLAMALLIGFYKGYTAGSLANLSTFTQVVLMAASLAFFIGWFAMTRLVVEVIGAPLIIDEMSLGDAIVEGALFVVDNFWAMYRLLIFSLGLLLIPLAGYWALLMVHNLSLVWPVLTPVAIVARFAGELFLWVSISVLGVLFYGAVFAFYRRDDAAVESEARENEESGEQPTPDQGGAARFEQGITLAELLPAETPHLFDTKGLFPASPSGASDQDEEDEKDRS